MSRAAVAAFPRSVRGNPYCDLLYGSLAARGVAIAAAGANLTFNGAGLDNEGTLTMNGGAINLAGAANVNRGNLSVSTVNLAGATLANQGSLTLNGGAILGTTGTLTNNPGGTISGTGLISAGFSNNGGSLLIGSGTINVTLTSATETLPGGALLQTVTMGLTVGTASVGCTPLANAFTTATAGSSPQLSGSVAAGTYCVMVSDVTYQLGPVAYAGAVSHP